MATHRCERLILGSFIISGGRKGGGNKEQPFHAHTDFFFFFQIKPVAEARRGEQSCASWHTGPAMLVPGSLLRAQADARREQNPSPASSHESAPSLSLIELKLFTLITQHGSKFPSRTRGAGELFDPLPRRCLSIQPLALEGWITRPSLFPVNYSR